MDSGLETENASERFLEGMQLHDVSIFRIDAAMKTRAAWDFIRAVSFRDANRQGCIARLGCDRSILLSFFCVLISFCISLAMCGCLGGQIIGANASAGSLQASTNNVSFGSVPLGTTTSASVSLVNQGSAAVQVSQVKLAGQSFAVSGAGNLPLTVAAGRSINLSVSFSPAATGMTTGELTISSDAASNGTLVVGLNGSGTAAGAPNPSELSSLSCVDAAATGPMSDICTVALSAAATGGGLTVSLTSDNTAVSLPASVTVAAGATSTSFTANVSSVSAGQTATLTASAGGVAKAFALQLNAPASGQGGAAVPVLSALSCTIGSITGGGTDSCTVMLSTTAPSGGFSVSLSSNNPAVAIPASVTVAAGSVSATFTASVVAVSSAQTVQLTASAGGVAQEFSLQLNVATAGLGINATSIAFGMVPVNTAVTQSVELTASGPLPIIIAAATVQGTGFSISGATFPITLAVGQPTTVEVTFDPTTAGAATGQLIIASTALASGTAVINLSGTGEAMEVNLTWVPPSSSPDPVAGYNVYRAPSGSTSYQQLNSSVVTQTTYVDLNVGSGQTYDYIVESVDASGVTSAPSNMAGVTLP